MSEDVATLNQTTEVQVISLEKAVRFALEIKDLWSADQFGAEHDPRMEAEIKEKLLRMERMLESALKVK